MNILVYDAYQLMLSKRINISNTSLALTIPWLSTYQLKDSELLKLYRCILQRAQEVKEWTA